MDVDAFFRAQDRRMNEPEDDMDEFMDRMAKARGPPDLYNSSFRSISFDTPTDPVHEESLSREGAGPSNHSLQLASAPPKEPTPVSTPPTVDEPMPEPSSPILVRASSPILIRDSDLSPPMRTLPRPSTPHISNKRKESPTKPDKPARKKAALDPSPNVLPSPSSPIEAAPEPSSKKPPSRKPKSARPLGRIAPSPPRPRPETIDLSMDDPIELPDFSVVVPRFEPQATSTQPQPGPIKAKPSHLFVEVEAQMRKKEEEKKKLAAKAARRTGKVSAPCKGNHISLSADDSIISVSSDASRPSSPPIKKKLPAKARAPPPPKPPQPVVQPKSASAAKKGGKGKKAEKIKMFPKDFAQMLLDEPMDPSARRREKFLTGLYIFYTGGDMTWASEGTRGRMKLIVEHGGNLCPVFDPTIVTHIISAAASAPALLRALGVRKMSEVPKHIPIITWNWVVSGQNGELGPLWDYAAYSYRIPEIEYPGRSAVDKGKGKQRAVVAETSAKGRKRSIHDSEDEDEDEDERPGGRLLPSPPSSPRGKGKARAVGASASSRKQTAGASSSSSRVKTENTEDPLAKFYAKAKFDRDNAWSRHGEVEDDGDETDPGVAPEESDDDEAAAQKQPWPPVKKSGWAVDNKEAQNKNGPNEFVAKKLEELMALHKAKPGQDDYWRGYMYSKALRPIRKYPKPIRSYEEAVKIQFVGHKTALKIMEIVETGDLRRIGYENTVDVQIRKLFQGIYGVGQTTAYQWYAAGCRSLKDLTAGKFGVTLTPAQKIGIEFYDDINNRMPREEAGALFELIKPIALAIDPKLEVHIMGSYRRGKKDCGDIDIMITRCPDDGKTHAGILHHLLKALHERKIITEDLALPDDPFDCEAIYRGLCRLPKVGARRRRIDFLTVPWKSRGAALLYYTGDDIFNRMMRYKANHLGYSLNQKGLFAGVVRDPRNRTVKTNAGNIVASETEEEIFRMLGVPFQVPRERVRA